jgi:Arc/MetJ family transcription regulator
MATEKVSITLDEELLREARERVGGRGLSAYVNEALRRKLADDRWDDFFAEAEREVGPIPDEVMEEVERRWLAGKRERRERMRQSA